MVVVDSGFVSTLAEAERAAKVVADAGVGRVLLFGSVARGEAHSHSDVDLMVIFDDLDYAVRHDLSMELGPLAGAEGVQEAQITVDGPQVPNLAACRRQRIAVGKPRHLVTEPDTSAHLFQGRHQSNKVLPVVGHDRILGQTGAPCI